MPIISGLRNESALSPTTMIPVAVMELKVHGHAKLRLYWLVFALFASAREKAADVLSSPLSFLHVIVIVPLVMLLGRISMLLIVTISRSRLAKLLLYELIALHMHLLIVIQ